MTLCIDNEEGGGSDCRRHRGKDSENGVEQEADIRHSQKGKVTAKWFKWPTKCREHKQLKEQADVRQRARPQSDQPATEHACEKMARIPQPHSPSLRT